MTKKTTTFEIIDHIGWDLWRATHVWKRRYTSEMINQGYPWFGEARGGLIQHIGPGGIAQTELAARAGMSKQAVQQLLDELVRDGVVERVTDITDARKKRVRFTRAGIEAQRTANRIKKRIEADYARLLGPAALAEFKKALALIIDSEEV